MTVHSRTRAARIRLVAGITIMGLLAVRPAVVSASPDQSGEDDPATQSDDAGDRGGEIDIEVDVYRGDQADVSDTLDSLTVNVRDQLSDLRHARSALGQAEAAVDAARATVAHTERRIERLVAESDEVVVDAFVNPPTDASLDALAADSLSDATIKQSILNTEASRSADVLADLATAREELEVQKTDEEDAVDETESRASDAEAELADLEAAQSQQALFVAQVQQRLDRNLAEADALAGLDPTVARRIREREWELAMQIQGIREAAETAEALAALQRAQEEAEAQAAAEAERLADQAGDIGAATGSLSNVACPAGGAITVDSSLASNLAALLDAGADAGHDYCGGGYRSPDEQIQRRRENCGTSYYAIYEMPSSECSPPTARPGSSMHEQGLAVDFTCDGSLVASRDTSCSDWLEANAGSFGLINLPAEPWHYSTNGR